MGELIAIEEQRLQFVILGKCLGIDLTNLIVAQIEMDQIWEGLKGVIRELRYAIALESQESELGRLAKAWPCTTWMML